MARGLSLLTACALAFGCATSEDQLQGGGAGSSGSGGLDAAAGGSAGTASGGASGSVGDGGAPSGGTSGTGATSGSGGAGGTASGGSAGSVSGGGTAGVSGTGGATGGTGGATGGTGGATGGTGGATGGTGGTIGNPPPAPTGQGCTTCDCCDPWVVTWTQSAGATYYNLIWKCLFIDHPINVGTATTADLCSVQVGMCSSSECANGVSNLQIQACNASGCSAKVPILNGLPIACGGGCCC